MRRFLSFCVLAAALVCCGVPAGAAEGKSPARKAVKPPVKSPAKKAAKKAPPPKAKPKAKPRSWQVLSGKPAPLRIGWGHRDVSTSLPVVIPGGWTRPISKGMDDELTVTALAIDNGFDAVIFLSCDHLGMSLGNNQLICNAARKLDPTVPPIEKWIVNATHTHSGVLLFGPGRHGIPEGIPFDDKGEYRNFFVKRAAQAVAEAWKKRSPGKVAWGYGYVVGGFSRRTIYSCDLSKLPKYGASPVLVGRGTMHGPNIPEFSHYEAGMDPIANYLFTFDMNDKLTGAIVNLSTTAQCGHPTANHLSADFWYEARQALRARFGGIYILPQCAAAGDITPVQQHYKAAQARRLKLKYGDRAKDFVSRYRLDIAERVAASFAEVLAWASKDKRRILPLCHTVITPQLEWDVYPEEDVAETKRRLAELEKLPATGGMKPEARLREESYRATRRGKYNRVIRAAEEVKKRPAAPTVSHIVRLGNIAFASNPFELFIDYMHRIQRQSPFEQTFIVQLAHMGGAHGGYLPTERAVANKGYSAEPYSHRTGPKGGATLVRATVEELRRLKELK